jgi:hypothetical protein
VGQFGNLKKYDRLHIIINTSVLTEVFKINDIKTMSLHYIIIIGGGGMF